MVSELPSCQLSLAFLTSIVQLKSTAPYLDDNIMMSYSTGWVELSELWKHMTTVFVNMHKKSSATKSKEKEVIRSLKKCSKPLFSSS